MPTYAPSSTGKSDENSDSGEEVEVEDGDFPEETESHAGLSPQAESHTDDAAQQKFTWNKDNIHKLAEGVYKQISAEDYLAPFNKVSINWKKVAHYSGIEEGKCQSKWQDMISFVRKYRTLPEIIGDALSKFVASDVAKYNKVGPELSERTVNSVVGKGSKIKHSPSGKTRKKKKPVNPDHPKRPPVNGYSLFCIKNIYKVTEKGVGKMSKLGTMWKALSGSEQQKYNNECEKKKEEYYKAVQKYAADHPEDGDIQQILGEEKKLHNRRMAKGSQKKSSDQAVGVSQEESGAEDMVSTESDSAQHSPKTSQVSPKKSKLQVKLFPSSPAASPKKRIHEESDELSSPSKKKKKKHKEEKVITGEDMYIEKKFASYREEHPDMEDAELIEKLKRKYQKLSEDKKARYIRKAEEKNT